MKNRFVRASQIACLVALPLAATFALTGCGSGSGNRSIATVGSGGPFLPTPAPTATPLVPTPTPSASPQAPTGTVSGSITYDADVITTDVNGTAFTPTSGSLTLPNPLLVSTGVTYLTTDFVFSAPEGTVDASGTPELLRRYLIKLTQTLQAGQIIDLKRPVNQIALTDISLTLEETPRGTVSPRKFKALSGFVTVDSIVDAGNTRTYTLLLTDVVMTPTSGISKFTVRGKLTYTGVKPSTTGTGLPGISY